MRILKNLKVDKVCILKSGEIIKTGGIKLLNQVEEEGFGEIGR